MTDTIIFHRFGVSDNGNVIEIITWHGRPQERRFVHRIAGLDRRARKQTARAWIDEHHPPRVYATIEWTTRSVGIVNQMSTTITSKDV